MLSRTLINKKKCTQIYRFITEERNFILDNVVLVYGCCAWHDVGCHSIVTDIRHRIFFCVGFGIEILSNELMRDP